mgnify:CR=1 FL=1
MSNSKSLITTENILEILDTCYDYTLNGIKNVSPSVEDMAHDYLSKHSTKEEACNAMLNNQVIKCTTSGFITGFGGFITMPIAIPANISSVIYVQMRMIACASYMAGYDLKSDQTQTLVYACLAGVAVNQVFKQFGIKTGTKLATSLVNKVPGKVLISINKKVGFRFLTKFGSKGILNLGKLVPGVGAVISGSLDFFETKAIAKRSYAWFFDDDFSVGVDEIEAVNDSEVIDT